MSRTLKRILFTIGGAAALLALLASGVLLFMDVNRYRPRLEAAASDALGMDVRIGGRLGVGLWRGFHVAVDDGRIVDAQGAVVASAKRTTLWIDLAALLRKEIRLRRIDLTQPRLSIERGLEGKLNVEGLKKCMARLGDLDGARVSLTGGTLLYADAKSGERIEAADVDLAVSRVRGGGMAGPEGLKRLSFDAELSCGEIQSNNLSLSALKASVHVKGGVLELNPVTMRIFGGQLAGDLRAEVSDPVPHCQIRCALPQFRIEEFLRVLSPKKAVEGAMDFTASLSMQGETMSQMVQTATGEISVRGENLALEGTDLDATLSRFESSQSFNLVDVGAVFFAGPLGLAVTKGYTFASLFQGSGGSSRIHTLVSDWRVERGVAQARDVALATPENRIALQGGLDFVSGRFADVTVAVIDAGGCATVRQSIRGSFGKPEVEKPAVLKSLSGPFRKLYKNARGLFPSGPCKVFYSGSVAPPG